MDAKATIRMVREHADEWHKKKEIRLIPFKYFQRREREVRNENG